MTNHKILDRDPMDEILKALRLFDDDETGKLSFMSLKRVAKGLGEQTGRCVQEDDAGDQDVEGVIGVRHQRKTVLIGFVNVARRLQRGQGKRDRRAQRCAGLLEQVEATM